MYAATRRLEGVLFLAREPVSARKLAELAGLCDGTQARTLVKRLNDHYDRIGRAFWVYYIAGGYQLATRPQFAPWVRRLGHGVHRLRLSAPALETLTVVAYRQPIPRAEIEAIRGVSCGEILKQLMERGLVRIAGRSPELGRPFLYGTTKQFLAAFGLGGLSQLPRADRWRGQGLPQWLDANDNLARQLTLPHSDSETESTTSLSQEENTVSLASSIVGRDEPRHWEPDWPRADDEFTPGAPSAFSAEGEEEELDDDLDEDVEDDVDDEDEDEEFDEDFDEEYEDDDEFEDDDEDDEWEEVDDDDEGDDEWEDDDDDDEDWEEEEDDDEVWD